MDREYTFQFFCILRWLLAVKSCIFLYSESNSLATVSSKICGGGSIQDDLFAAAMARGNLFQIKSFYCTYLVDKFAT